MWNPTATGPDTLLNTATSLTLGYGPGQQAPPQMLLQSLAAGGTVTLSKINQVGPTAPGTPGTTPATGDGYILIIKNLTTQTTTITPASGDTCDASSIINTGDVIIMQADAPNSKWRLLTSQNLNTGGGAVPNFVTTASANTVATTTRYLLMSGAVAVTLPAAFPTYQPVTIMNESGGSDTITPASGNINTTAAFTLTTLKSATFISDGTNWHLVDN